MKQCPNCRNPIREDAAFCPVCGTAVSAPHAFPEPYPPQQPVTPPPMYVPPVPKVNPFDHTGEYHTQDIQEHKLFCMLVYLFDIWGILLALLLRTESPYTTFHIRQSMKFCVVEAVLVFASGLLCWSVVIPVLAVICLVVVLVLKFISFLQVCKGKALEPALIRKLNFLK